MIELSANHAKRLVISKQGLHKSNVFGRCESAPLECITRLGYVQIDTISVINRAHHHTFWTRIPKYHAGQLDALQRDRRIFEYWSHAAAYLPMHDYRFCLPYMNAIAAGQKHWRKPDKTAMKSVLNRIRSEGPLKARDFESCRDTKSRDGKSAAVWSGKKPAKEALEQLFIEGQLMISHRDGFQKVFDLTDRVLPAEVNREVPATEEFCRYLIDRTIRSQGLATESEMGYLRKGTKSALRIQVQQMLADREIVQVRVPENSSVYYSKPEFVEQGNSVRVSKSVHLLSPFDNLVIQRKRLAQLFDYDYQIECYVPEKKRVHGYFCLPILFGSELVARLDPKADRAKRIMVIRNLVIEKEIVDRETFIKKMAAKLKEFAAFNDCDQISIERCNAKAIGNALVRKVQ